MRNITKVAVWGISLAMLLAPSNAQLSVVMALAGRDVRTFVNLYFDRDDIDWSQYSAINTIANIFSIVTGEDNEFKGTVFLPLDETMEELENSPVYDRVFEDESFDAHLRLFLFNHLVPGDELDLAELEEDSNSQLETAAGEIIDAKSIIPAVVEPNINSIDVTGHVIDKLLLPSFWDTSVRDVVGNPDLSDDEVYTVYLPPILEVADCSTFWEAHVVEGEVIAEPAIEVIETIFANNGIVHRMAQSFSYDPCPTEAPTRAPTTSPTLAPTASPTASPTNEPTKAPTEDSLPVLPATGNASPDTSPSSTHPPTSDSASSANDDEVEPNTTGISNASQGDTELNYIPIIAGVSVASCLIAIGCVLGLLFFGQGGKQAKPKPKPQRESSGLPSNFFDAPTVCPNPEPQTQGFVLDPSVQEPSLLTLPTFIDRTRPQQ